MAKITMPQKLTQFIRLPGLNQQGQSIIIITFAILGLIAMLGLALDLGLVYIERTRVKRAVDAATLAGVVELPSEEQAFIRAINYLDENGYRLRDGNGNPQTNVYVRGCAHSGYLGSANFQNYHNTSTNPASRPTVARDNDGDGDTETYYLYFPSTGAAVTNPRAEFFIDTRSFQSTNSDAPDDFAPDSEQCSLANSLRGTANKLKIDGIIPVNMNFMQFFGFRRVPVWDEAIAQNITNLDVAIVFDISGSMQFDTVCYGCYEIYGDGSQDWVDLTHTDYPNPSFVNPIPSDHLPEGTLTDPNHGGVGDNDGNLCEGRDGNTVDYYTGLGAGSRRFIIIEGELYSLNTSVLYGPLRQPGSGYWAIQHTNWRSVHRMEGENWDPDTSYQVGATPILYTNPTNLYTNSPYTTGSWVSHHPYVSWAIGAIPFGHDYTLAEVQADPDGAPSLEYDFITSGQPTLLWNDSGNTRIWARVQAGSSWADTTALYWAVYDYTDLQNNGAAAATPLNGAIQTPQTSPVRGSAYGGADSDKWRWIELTRAGLDLQDTTRTKYTLKIWAGGPGYDIDQIVIGNANDTGFTSSYGTGVPARVQATPGSAFRQACNRCNGMYGLTVDMADCQSPSDNGWYDSLLFTQGQVGQDLTNPDINKLFSGYQPLRGAKEAVKRFITKLNPQFDQVGVATYSTGTLGVIDGGRMELRCRRYYNADTCFQGTNPISFTEVLGVVERVPPNGSTNIARGIVRGLEMLGVNADNLSATAWATANDCNSSSDHCSRGGSARRILIVMTDGVANVTHNSTCDDVDLYTPNGPNSDENRAQDCAMFYAQMAAQNNITIYTIGLGNGVDTRFLETIAKLPGSDGEYFAAVSPAQLNDIFDTILNSISVRLIQ